MAENNRDTIYVDIDDEITALIDKVKSSSSRVVALVLPKRASVLQSVVNMKLLKRSAEDNKKNLVLITTEASLLPLAGAVGLYVAKTLDSKPMIPSSPNLMAGSLKPETIDEDMGNPLDEDEELPDLTKKVGAAASVGALAEAAKNPLKAAHLEDNLETIELDNEPHPEADESDEALASEDKKAKKSKSFKVPDFDRFRLLALIGIAVIIVLAVLGFLLIDVWPHASVAIKTDASNVNANVNLTLDSQSQSPDFATGNIPATQVTQQKTFTQTVNTTGQKNEGNSATGTVVMSANDCNNTYGGVATITIPSGTVLTATNNLTYATQSDTTLYSNGGKGGCTLYSQNPSYFPVLKIKNTSTPIIAQSPGSNYNTNGSTTFSVAGYSGVTATGSASGGTDDVVQVVAQADIASATAKINANDVNSVRAGLVNQLKGQGLYPIIVTFASGSPQTTSNPAVGTPSNTVTVTETITYSMYGVHQSDLTSALKANILSQTGKNQNIMNDGLNNATFKQVNSTATTDEVSLSALAEVGPNISGSTIKHQISGKSPQEVIKIIKTNPDVTGVSVKLSPFYVSTIPTNLSNVTVTVAKPTKSV